jgi:hypothetical protein
MRPFNSSIVRSWLLRVRYNDCDYDLRRDIGDVRSRLQLNRRMIQFEKYPRRRGSDARFHAGATKPVT